VFSCVCVWLLLESRVFFYDLMMNIGLESLSL
jgi:hypothetical protein